MHWTDGSTLRVYLPVLVLMVLSLFFIPLAQAAQQPPVSGNPASSPAAPRHRPATPPTTPTMPPSGPAHVQPRFLVVIDPAHGGTDSGARLNAQMLEKDLVLALSLRLRSALNAHGISVVTTRESDVLVSPVNRAETADHAVAAACISLHATATGSGIHLFTSSLTEIPVDALSALGYGARRICPAESAALLGDRFGDGARGDSGHLGPHRAQAAGQLYLPRGRG